MPKKLMQKTIESLGEFGLIREIQKWIPKSKAIRQGIGDDAAVFDAPGGKYQLLTIDTIVEDVDFIKSKATPQEIGWKALAINLSDIAAMGGIPKVAVASLTLPKRTSVQFVKGFYEGVRKLANRFQVTIVGGDLSSGPKISSSIAVLGEAQKKWTVFRKGAKVGDLVCVTGRLGGSILGKHLRFTPRVKEGQFLAKQGVSAMIDLSDGLGQDLDHLIQDSAIAFLIDEKKIPISSNARKLSRGNTKRELIHAFCDGEDFELLFTIAPRKFRRLKQSWKKHFTVALTVIGRVVKWRRAGLTKSKSLGFQHF